ncbi:MAG: hypothetical protein JNL60_04160 [Bacteroidia bacterium]|nr:hypothetical protein [Bacteroidia bacterium]
MTRNITEDKAQSQNKSFSAKSPLKWIVLGGALALAALIYLKDKKVFLENDSASPLFNPPAKSEQQLEKEKQQSPEENKLKEKF